MDKQNRPLKVVRSKPKTHKKIIAELKKRQAGRKKPEASSFRPVEIKTSTKVVKMSNIRKPVKPEPIVQVNIQEQKGNVHSVNKLCIGSIFVDCDELSEQWLDLQLRYIKATTTDFHHVSLVQNSGSIKISKFFSNNTEVIRPIPESPKTARDSQAHVIGLKGLHNYFKKHQATYENFLFIDMDAFPIRKNWYDILLRKLKKHEIAIALRSENLETRLHSSILFCKKQGLAHLDWGVHKVGNDLIGRSESDVNLISHQAGVRRKNSYVLLRSNQYQIHPLLCGVYYDLFYHHGCGSGRKFNMRSRPYWGHIVNPRFDVMESINDLMNDPNEFIGKLAGWHRNEYPQV